MTQNDEAERLARDCKTAAKCLKYEGSFETGQAILTEAAALIRTQAARIAELEARAEAEARGYARAMEDAAAVADTCRRENGPMSKKGFPEDYRRGLEAAGQAIATAIRALAQKEAGE